MLSKIFALCLSTAVVATRIEAISAAEVYAEAEASHKHHSEHFHLDSETKVKVEVKDKKLVVEIEPKKGDKAIMKAIDEYARQV